MESFRNIRQGKPMLFFKCRHSDSLTDILRINPVVGLAVQINSLPYKTSFPLMCLICLILHMKCWLARSKWRLNLLGVWKGSSKW